MCFDYANLGNEKLADFIGEVPDYQIWSITSSCLALAWSFNTYQATRMNGALDFTKNPAGRITLLLSCICQISSRLVILVTRPFHKNQILEIHIAQSGFLVFGSIETNVRKCVFPKYVSFP